MAEQLVDEAELTIKTSTPVRDGKEKSTFSDNVEETQTFQDISQHKGKTAQNSISREIQIIIELMETDFQFRLVERLLSLCEEVLRMEDYNQLEEIGECLYRFGLLLTWKDVAIIIRDFESCIACVENFCNDLENMELSPENLFEIKTLFLLGLASIYSHVREFEKANEILEDIRLSHDALYPYDSYSYTFDQSRLLGMILFETYKLTVGEPVKDQYFCDALEAFNEAEDFILKDMKFLCKLAVLVDVPFDVSFEADAAQEIYSGLDEANFPTQDKLLKLMIAIQLEKELEFGRLKEDLLIIKKSDQIDNIECKVYIISMLLQLPQLDKELREVLFTHAAMLSGHLPNTRNRFYLSIRLLVSNRLDQNQEHFISSTVIPYSSTLLKRAGWVDYRFLREHKDILYLRILFRLHRANCFYKIEKYSLAFEEMEQGGPILDMLRSKDLSKFEKMALQQVTADTLHGCAAIFCKQERFERAEEKLLEEISCRKLIPNDFPWRKNSLDNKMKSSFTNLDFVRRKMDKHFITPRVLAISFKQVSLRSVFPEIFE